MGLLATLWLYGYALYGAAWVFLQLIIGTVLHPTTPFWKAKRRKAPPKCLNDPALGTHGYLNINGLRIHYVENGDKQKPLMLFLHGFPEFWYSWRHQLIEFAKDYWTVAIDMRGYGDSDKPEGVHNYQMNLLVDDVKKVVTALDREKFILVAHDWGGAIAWNFVHTHPEMIQSYVILDAPYSPGFMKIMKDNKKQLKMSWYVFFFQLPCLPEIFCRSFDMMMFDHVLKKAQTTDSVTKAEDIEAYKYAFGKPGAFTPPINYYRATFSGKREKQQRKEIESPGIFIFGEKENYLVPENLEVAKKSVKNLEIATIEGASHFVQQDAPEKLNKVIRKFLAKKS